MDLGFVHDLLLIRIVSRFGYPCLFGLLDFNVQVLELPPCAGFLSSLHAAICHVRVTLGMLELGMVGERASLECVVTKIAPDKLGVVGVIVVDLSTRVSVFFVILKFILVNRINPFPLERVLILFGLVLLVKAFVLVLLVSLSRPTTMGRNV